MTSACIVVAGAIHAADISWSAPEDYEIASDVSTQGVLVEAINATGAVGAASPIVNGVLFRADTTLLDEDATTDFLDGDTGDLGYNQLLNSLDFGNSASIQTGGGVLESGKEYLIQAWFLDERSSSDDRAMQFEDGNGNQSAEVNDQYVIGTFIADGSSQTLIVNGVESGPHLNAYQVRDLSSSTATLTTSVGQTVLGVFDVSISFSESVTGLMANDFSVENGAVSNVSGGGTSWSCSVTPANNGDVLVTLPANTVLDEDNHGNVVSNTILTTYVPQGAEQPVPSLSTSETNVYGDYTVNVDFSEPVSGLSLNDFSISGGTISNLSGSGANYTVVVSPNFGGDVTLSLPRNSVTDMDRENLQNVASNELVNAFFITVTVSSPSELLPYMSQDNVTATLAPGTYTIDADDVNDTYGTPRFEIWGNNSTYDFTGVTINFAADIYEFDLSMSHIQIFGNNNVLKNLRMIDLCDKYGDLSLAGGVNIIMDGEHNRVEGFYLEVRGSYPYGYGDCFGKGGTYTIKHSKHSGVLVRGNYNHLLNTTLMQESYGHCIFMQAASYPTIEGCYVETETRTTDEMLAETSGPAFDIDFMTVWGFRLPGGFTKSMTEAGIRAYNAGNTYINGVWYSRGTNDPTILDNTLVNTRVGVTLTHATGFKFVSGCTAIGTERGYAIGSGVIENCYSDVKHGPAFGVDYSSDSGVIADITIIPHEGTNYNGSKHIAYIQGRNHNLTFRSTVHNPEQELEINVGGDFNHISASQEVNDNPADDMIINNLTGYPIVVGGDTNGIEGQSIGPLMDTGGSTSITTNTWDVANNLAFAGTATQSSNAFDTLASFATDQNTNGSFFDGSVTHTDNETQAWWKVDLKGPRAIAEIRIWGRTGSNESRLSDYDVSVLDANEQVVWTNYQSDYPDPYVSVFPGAEGQYVIIQLRGDNPLSLAEVEVFGTAPDPPTGLTAASNSGQIVLNWDSATAANSYRVKRSTSTGGPYTLIDTTTGASLTDRSALSGVVYHYIVTAVNGGESAPSNEVFASITTEKFTLEADDITVSEYQDPNVPSHTVDGNLTTRWSARGEGQWIRYDLGAKKNVYALKIAWLNGATRVSSFSVETSNDGATWTSITGTLGSSGTTTELETVDVPATLARYVRIVGYGNTSNTWNSINEVEIWGTVVAPPMVPTNFTAIPHDGQVALSWTVSAGATQHYLKRSGAGGRGYTTIASEAGGSYVDTSVNNGTTYYYVVSAQSDGGESADSVPVSAKPYAPIAPSELITPLMSRVDDSLELAMGSVVGRIYQLQRSETLAPDDWEDVGEPVVGTGSSMTLSDSEAFLAPKCFYRLQIHP